MLRNMTQRNHFIGVFQRVFFGFLCSRRRPLPISRESGFLVASESVLSEEMQKYISPEAYPTPPFCFSIPMVRFSRCFPFRYLSVPPMAGDSFGD